MRQNGSGGAFRLTLHLVDDTTFGENLQDSLPALRHPGPLLTFELHLASDRKRTQQRQHHECGQEHGLECTEKHGSRRYENHTCSPFEESAKAPRRSGLFKNWATRLFTRGP